MPPVTTHGQTTLLEDDLYPTSDGQPMGETELHADEMVELRLMLRRHFRARADAIYVGSNLFVYFERGNSRAVFSPDVFVVFGAPQRQYDTYKLWEDGPAPSFVIEVTSKSTRLEDKGNKKAVCEMLGVTEYFMYDPRAEYLDPPLQGYRLRSGQYEPIALDDRGAVRSGTLGLCFSLDASGFVVVHDLETGLRLLRVEEERERLEREQSRAETERQRAEAECYRERAARQEAEQRLEAALRELERRRRGGNSRP